MKRVCNSIFIFLVFSLVPVNGLDYSYDDLNRLVKIDLDDGSVIQYSYDAAGNRKTHVVTASNAPATINNLAVSISGNSAVLTWSPVTGATSYKIYRGTEPYFSSNSSYATVPSPGFTDANVLGNPATNYYYYVTAISSNGELAPSNRVGEFDFDLVTTSTTDFNEVALPLNISSVATAADLMDAIPNCNSVARWNASVQGYDQYIPGVPPTNFSISMGYPYYVNVTANTIFTLVGEYSNPSFNLITTTTTDFNEVMLPLDKSSITTASQLMAAIPNCNSIAKWNAQMQGYDQYISAIPPTNFAVRVGYPYYVNVTADGVWPAGSLIAAQKETEPSAEAKRTSQPLSTHAPHAVYGQFEVRGDSSSIEEKLSFKAFIRSRPEEIITNTAPGCLLSNGWWIVQCAAFPTAWQAGDVLCVEFSQNGILIGRSECALTYTAAESNGKITLSLQDETFVPSSFKLFQNYPNPFNAGTEIRYGLPRTCHVTLSIYNSTGQLVTTLIDEQKEAGFHIEHWNPQSDAFGDLASGLFFCRINAGGYSHTIKLLLLK